MQQQWPEPRGLSNVRNTSQAGPLGASGELGKKNCMMGVPDTHVCWFGSEALSMGVVGEGTLPIPTRQK